MELSSDPRLIPTRNETVGEQRRREREEEILTWMNRFLIWLFASVIVMILFVMFAGSENSVDNVNLVFKWVTYTGILGIWAFIKAKSKKMWILYGSFMLATAILYLIALGTL